MKIKFLIHALQHNGGTTNNGDVSRLQDFMAPLGTLCVLVGLLIALMQQEEIANYLVATGLLLHLTAWFENWWKRTNTSRAR